MLAALILGGAGAGGAHVLAERLELPAEGTAPRVTEARAVKVVEAEGQVMVATSRGDWRPLHESDSVDRPAVLKTSGLASELGLALGKTRIRASQDARLRLNAPGKPLKVYIESGRVVVYRPGTRIVSVLPGRRITARGGAYGIWVQPTRTLIAVLEGELDLEYRGETKTYAPGREIILGAEDPAFSALPKQLSVYIERAVGGSGGYRVTGKTSPNAQLVVKRPRGHETVAVNLSGRFETRISGAKPVAGELIAFDTAGRRAEVGKASPEMSATEPSTPATSTGLRCRRNER